MAENKMEQVAALFDKKLGERFKIARGHMILDCSFNAWGFDLHSTYDSRFIESEASILEELLIGEAVIVDEDRG